MLRLTVKPHGKTALFFLACILLLAMFLHLGALTSDIQRGIPDWHPDSARYLVQCEQYIRGNFKPIGKTPWYTGNPYANILMLSYLWKGLDKLSLWTGHGHIPLNKLNLSLVSRLFYLALCLLMAVILYFFATDILGSPAIGLLAAVFWALSPLSVSINHIIKPEIPLAFFVTLTAIFAFHISEKDSIALYLIAGISGGIAAAVKYNGAIVLLYLFLMHAYRVARKEHPRGLIGMLRRLFGLRIILAAIASLFAFYAFEPILWLGLSKGFHFIRQYLHTAAFTATPPGLKAHGGIISFLFYSLKSMPHNLGIFTRSAGPFVLAGAAIALFVPPPMFRSKIYRIALHPLIILFILFTTKPLIGAEFLLHPLPFVFILAAAGFYFLFKQPFRLPSGITKAFAFIFIGVTLAWSLYGSLFEIRFFSIGNIRYHAGQWALDNLTGQCVARRSHLIRTLPWPCDKQHPVAVAKYSKAGFQSTPGTIVLKTFNLEKKKPLVHLIRGYKIRFEGLKPFFDAPPLIPRIPLPHSFVKKRDFTRFMNGTDLDPAYNGFFLHPNTTYAWTLVSKAKKHRFNCLIVNGDRVSVVRSPLFKKPLRLLPYEKRPLALSISPGFPWHSPFLYQFSLRSSGDIFFKLTPGGPEPSLHDAILPSSVTPERAVSLITSLERNDKGAFNRIFYSLFHYDYRFLKNFLSYKIPLKTFIRSSQPRFFFKKWGAKDHYLWTPKPIFLNRGNYELDVQGDFILLPGTRVNILLVSHGRTFVKKTLSIDTNNLRCFPHNRFRLPFKIPSSTPVYFAMIVRGNGAAFLEDVTVQYPFKKNLEVALRQRILRHTLEDDAFLLSNLHIVGTCRPEWFSPSLRVKIGAALARLGKEQPAIPWLVSAVRDDPLYKKAYLLLAKLDKKLNLPQNTREIQAKLHIIERVTTGNWKFETGLSLRGFAIPHITKRGGEIPVTLYLALPAFNGTQSAFISFFKDGNFYFARDFSLLAAVPKGNLYKIMGRVKIPGDIPTGAYDIHFTFRIPTEDYRYRPVKNGKKSSGRNVFLQRIRID